MNANRNFKNNVFTTLFHDPGLLLELYCALEGVTLPKDTPVSINTLENVLFLEFNNDISFEIGGKLVILIEHQSTVNPNMALRFLLYFANILEKKIDSKTLYSRKKLTMPWPEFYVLYNGFEPVPDVEVLRLSDLFEKTTDLGLSKKARPLLDLEVKVININEGRNEEIVKRCGKLSEYCAFMGKIRALFNELKDKEKSVTEAIKYCRKNDILVEYLEIHGSEVLNMILTEWNTEDAIAFAREEGREEGRESGLEEGEEKANIKIARNLLCEGSTPDFVHKITGLSPDEIVKL